MIFKSRKLFLYAAVSLLLTGCSSINIFGESDDPPLPGERVSVLELQKKLEPENTALNAQGFVAPNAWQNEFWPQRGGYPNHALQHLSFTEGAFKEAWSVSIGKGATRHSPLMAQPIIVAGMIFTLDTNLEVRAFDIQNGKLAWKSSVKPPEEGEITIGGGLAFNDGLLYVANGFAEVAAFDPLTGQLVWRTTLNAPVASAPTTLEQKLYVQLSNNQLVALDTKSGQELWSYKGFEAESGLIGSSSPAASKELVVAAFSSGEITGIDAASGAVVWSDTLAPRRRAGGISSVSDVIALPIIDRDMVFGVGFGKRMLALNPENGRRLWQRDIASLETPWVVGNHIFVVTTDNNLIALGRESGAVNWVLDMAAISRDDEEFWTGPVFAGSRLIIASSEGQIAEISPVDGSLIRASRAEGNVRVPPIIANNTMYILSDNGKLTAYR